MTQTKKGSIDKFVLRETDVVQENLNENLESQFAQVNHLVEIIENENVANIEDNDRGENNNEENENNDRSLNIYDLRVWDSLHTKMRDLLVEKCPIREVNFKYPCDEHGWHFSSKVL